MRCYIINVIAASFIPTHSHPLLTTMTDSNSKPPSSVEESIANMSAQIEKLATAFAGI
jgi:hypothetical protein